MTLSTVLHVRMQNVDHSKDYCHLHLHQSQDSLQATHHQPLLHLPLQHNHQIHWCQMSSKITPFYSTKTICAFLTFCYNQGSYIGYDSISVLSQSVSLLQVYLLLELSSSAVLAGTGGNRRQPAATSPLVFSGNLVLMTMYFKMSRYLNVTILKCQDI